MRCETRACTHPDAGGGAGDRSLHELPVFDDVQTDLDEHEAGRENECDVISQ